MATKVIDLQPNRDLLQPDFNGYKLSLAGLPTVVKVPTSVDRVLPDVGQYSLLHAKLFGLHNHVVGETIADSAYLYFVDKNWTVQKVYVDQSTSELYSKVPIWQIPNKSERQKGDYNISLKLLNDDLAVLSDGTGMLYIMGTGCRSLDNRWDLLYSEDVLGQGKPFLIQDALHKITDDDKKEIHLLLLRIHQVQEHFEHLLSWVTLTKGADEKWGVSALRKLTGKGELYYCYFEPGCDALYVASDNGFKFTIDSENPLSNSVTELITPKRYVWTQTTEDIQIKFKLPQNFISTMIKVETKADEVVVKYAEELLLSGQPYQAIDSSLTNWTTSNDVLEVSLNKLETGLMWPELVEGDDAGEYIIDPSTLEEVHRRLQHLTSETEAIPQGGTTFNSQQIEECDFTNDKSSIFQRICCKTHNVTHRINLGTYPVIMSVKLFPDQPPALGLRHDVDVLLWQPYGKADEWTVKHEGTLLAFGYVQASKQQRKFLSCSPNLDYSVICESSRHVFLYCQNKPVTGGQLKNRTSGKRIETIAEQRVISLDNEEILGFYMNNTCLCLLTETSVLFYSLE